MGFVTFAYNDRNAASAQVYLRQLVCVSAAWRLQQLTSFLDVGTSMMGVQSQIGDVLDQVDRMEGLCVDLKRQVIDDSYLSYDIPVYLSLIHI